jgi:hypothetical protein
MAPPVASPAPTTRQTFGLVISAPLGCIAQYRISNANMTIGINPNEHLQGDAKWRHWPMYPAQDSRGDLL